MSTERIECKKMSATGDAADGQEDNTTVEPLKPFTLKALTERLKKFEFATNDRLKYLESQNKG